MKFNRKAAFNFFIALIFFFLIALLFLFVRNAYQNYQNEKDLAIFKEEMQLTMTEFQNNENRGEKLESLKLLLDDSNSCFPVDPNFTEKTDIYQTNISDMKNWFMADYNKIIEENKFDDKDGLKKLKLKRTNLKNLIETIKNEQSIVLSEADAEKQISDINAIIDKCDKKIDKINEEKEKKDNAKNQNININNTSKNTSNNSSSSNKNSNSGPGTYMVSGEIWLEDGTKTWIDNHGYFHYNDKVYTPEQWQDICDGLQP